jgi:hypothetical protein
LLAKGISHVYLEMVETHLFGAVSSSCGEAWLVERPGHLEGPAAKLFPKMRLHNLGYTFCVSVDS